MRTELTYDIYVKPIHNAFLGDGRDSLIVKDGIILAATRAWFDPAATPGFRHIKQDLVGQPASKRGKGWRKLTGFKAENAQYWADDVLYFDIGE